jgi:hypothetical protein
MSSMMPKRITVVTGQWIMWQSMLNHMDPTLAEKDMQFILNAPLESDESRYVKFKEFKQIFNCNKKQHQSDVLCVFTDVASKPSSTYIT